MPIMMADFFLINYAKVWSVSVTYKDDTGLYQVAVRAKFGETRKVLFALGATPERALTNAHNRAIIADIDNWRPEKKLVMEE